MYIRGWEGVKDGRHQSPKNMPPSKKTPCVGIEVEGSEERDYSVAEKHDA